MRVYQDWDQVVRPSKTILPLRTKWENIVSRSVWGNQSLSIPNPGKWRVFDIYMAKNWCIEWEISLAVLMWKIEFFSIYKDFDDSFFEFDWNMVVCVNIAFVVLFVFFVGLFCICVCGGWSRRWWEPYCLPYPALPTCKKIISLFLSYFLHIFVQQKVVFVVLIVKAWNERTWRRQSKYEIIVLPQLAQFCFFFCLTHQNTFPGNYLSACPLMTYHGTDKRKRKEKARTYIKALTWGTDDRHTKAKAPHDDHCWEPRKPRTWHIVAGYSKWSRVK